VDDQFAFAQEKAGLGDFGGGDGETAQSATTEPDGDGGGLGRKRDGGDDEVGLGGREGDVDLKRFVDRWRRWERSGDGRERMVETDGKRTRFDGDEFGETIDDLVAQVGLGEERVFGVAAWFGIYDEARRAGAVVVPEVFPGVGNDGVARVDLRGKIGPWNQAGEEVGIDVTGGRNPLGDGVGFGIVAPNEDGIGRSGDGADEVAEAEEAGILVRVYLFSECVKTVAGPDQGGDESEAGEKAERGAFGRKSAVPGGDAGEEPAAGETEAGDQLKGVVREVAAAECRRNETGEEPAEEEQRQEREGAIAVEKGGEGGAKAEQEGGDADSERGGNPGGRKRPGETDGGKPLRERDLGDVEAGVERPTVVNRRRRSRRGHRGRGGEGEDDRRACGRGREGATCRRR